MDCQKKGSQLSLVAALMGAAYGIIGLNALFMFIGAWRFRWRVCSIYCTFVACLFQFAILVTAGVLLMTKYNNVCSRSMTITAPGYARWTMADDFSITFQLWISTIFTTFIFLCCGMCSAWNPDK